MSNPCQVSNLDSEACVSLFSQRLVLCLHRLRYYLQDRNVYVINW